MSWISSFFNLNGLDENLSLLQEVALVHHTERTATVETVTHMQMLVVSREDFLDIFFSPEESGEPEHVQFCRCVKGINH